MTMLGMPTAHDDLACDRAQQWHHSTMLPTKHTPLASKHADEEPAGLTDGTAHTPGLLSAS